VLLFAQINDDDDGRRHRKICCEVYSTSEPQLLQSPGRISAPNLVLWVEAAVNAGGTAVTVMSFVILSIVFVNYYYTGCVYSTNSCIVSLQSVIAFRLLIQLGGKSMYYCLVRGAELNLILSFANQSALSASSLK